MKTNKPAKTISKLRPSMSIAILSISTDGKIRAWDKGAEQLFGYTCKDIIGSHISHVIPDRTLLENSIEKLNDGEVVAISATAGKRRDERGFQVSLSMAPASILSGNILCIAKIIPGSKVYY